MGRYYDNIDHLQKDLSLNKSDIALGGKKKLKKDTFKQHSYTFKMFSDKGQLILKEWVFNFLEMPFKSLTFFLLNSEIIALGKKNHLEQVFLQISLALWGSFDHQSSDR